MKDMKYNSNNSNTVFKNMLMLNTKTNTHQKVILYYCIQGSRHNC